MFNKAEGWEPEDLPFDIRHRRLLSYTLVPGADAAERAKVAKQLTDAFDGRAQSQSGRSTQGESRGNRHYRRCRARRGALDLGSRGSRHSMFTKSEAQAPRARWTWSRARALMRASFLPIGQTASQVWRRSKPRQTISLSGPRKRAARRQATARRVTAMCASGGVRLSASTTRQATSPCFSKRLANIGRCTARPSMIMPALFISGRKRHAAMVAIA